MNLIYLSRYLNYAIAFICIILVDIYYISYIYSPNYVLLLIYIKFKEHYDYLKFVIIGLVNPTLANPTL